MPSQILWTRISIKNIYQYSRLGAMQREATLTHAFYFLAVRNAWGIPCNGPAFPSPTYTVHPSAHGLHALTVSRTKAHFPPGSTLPPLLRDPCNLLSSAHLTRVTDAMGRCVRGIAAGVTIQNTSEYSVRFPTFNLRCCCNGPWVLFTLIVTSKSSANALSVAFS